MHFLNKTVTSPVVKRLLNKESIKVLSSLRSASHDGKNTQPQRTALYDFHVKSGGKIVDFGGYALPVQYADQGISASHLHTRQEASLFDVSHMLQTYVRGKGAIAAIESICTADIRGLPDGAGTLTVFTNDKGGILDDLIVTKVDDQTLYIVSNAAMKAQDMNIMQEAVTKFKANGDDVTVEFMPTSEQSLIALQGPKAVAALSQLLPSQVSMEKVYFMNSVVHTLAGVENCRITRCGYTGEDGVEISVSSEKIQHVTEAILAASESVKLAGLGARDSLRLEAGLCLYGSDINAQITPIEAGLAWLVAKRRRQELNFPGAEHIVSQLKNGVSRRRVGLQLIEPTAPPARAHTKIFHDGTLVGEVTSGCPSPSLSKNIAMCYVEEALKGPGTPLQLEIRNKRYEAAVTKMPFVKANYYTKPKA